MDIIRELVGKQDRQSDENDAQTLLLSLPDNALDFALKYWSVKGKLDRKPYSLEGHWFQETILNDTCEQLVVMKAGQLGISEIFLALATYFAATRGNVIYFFPTTTHVKDFVQGRFNPTIQHSDFLTSIVGSVEASEGKQKKRKDSADNTSIKKVANHFFYFRGSNKPTQLKSVDGDMLVLDEYDEMVQANIPLAKSRIDHSAYKWIRSLSTPTYEEYGIHNAFLEGDQRYLHIKCEHCGEWQALTWEENINPGISMEHRICRKCRKPINHCGKGEWVATYPGRKIHSYHISQLYSPAVSVEFLVDFQAKPENEEEFFRSKLGLPYTPKGGSLTKEEVRACQGDYKSIFIPEGVCTMGIDVGRKLHFQISRWFNDEKKKVLRAGTVDEFEDLDTLMKKYDITVCICDANPEYKKARDFALRFPGRVYLAYYPIMDKKDYYTISEGKHGELSVNINRTLSLDYTLDRYRQRGIVLPSDILADDSREGYVSQLCAPCKVKRLDAKGNEFYTYLEGSKADHYAHAANYDEVAGIILSKKEHREYQHNENVKGASILSKLKDVFDRF